MSTNNIERFDSSVLTVCHFCAKPAETGITGAPECDNWRYVKCSNDYCPLRHVLFTVDSWNGQWKGCVSLLDHQRIVKELEAQVQELERRLRIPFGKPPCAQCGGPHDFDTSLPPALWNGVIRAKGLPEYLCTTCIVREFVRANKSFTAELWNDEFSGVAIEVRIGQPVSLPDAIPVVEEMRDEYNQRTRSYPVNSHMRDEMNARTVALGEALTRLRSLSPGVAANCDVCGGSGKVTAGCAVDKPLIKGNCWKCARSRRATTEQSAREER